MRQWRSVDEVLDFAIGEEEAAAKFYTHLGGQMKTQRMRKVFERFAEEEMRHRQILLDVKAGGTFDASVPEISDLKIAEYVVDIDLDQEMDYQAALIVAMKKEKAAFRLYTDLAEGTEDEKIKRTLLSLTQEEAKHKLHFELEYDNVQKDN